MTKPLHNRQEIHDLDGLPLNSDEHSSVDLEAIPCQLCRQREENEEMLRSFFNANSDDYMAYWNSDLELKLANFHLAAEHMPFIAAVIKENEPAHFEATQDGRVFRYRAYPAKNALGACMGVAVFADDITKTREAEQEVHRLAYFDHLTGLANRTLLHDRLAQAMVGTRRHGNAGAVLSVNLDRFKNINESLGHRVGDEVLLKTAANLDACCREEDTVARVGGDEFLWVLPDGGDDAETAAQYARQAAHRLLSLFRSGVVAGGSELRLSPRIGIALFGPDKTTITEVLKQADTAMARAKEPGAERVQFYKPHMQQAATERLQLEIRLHEAIENNLLDLHFQPQVCIQTGKIVGAETLLRWFDPELGPVSPAKFIPVAEETGQILRIGKWVLDEVCQRIRIWNNSPSRNAIERVAINISPIQFRQHTFVSDIIDCITRWGIHPNQLELELTEGIVIDDIEQTVRKMNELREVGLRFAIDDFGTGYSSLAYLSKLPLDILKIDQSFVRNIEASGSDAAIVNSIISMAQMLDFELVAEGVETHEQLTYLNARLCNLYQGYLMSKPLPVSEFEEFLLSAQTPRAPEAAE